MTTKLENMVTICEKKLGLDLSDPEKKRALLKELEAKTVPTEV